MNAPRTFEWDDAKAASNLAKHGVSFSFAISVFLDPAVVVENVTKASGTEDRSMALGLIEDRLFAVVYTMRGPVCRVISARRTSTSEAKRYGL